MTCMLRDEIDGKLHEFRGLYLWFIAPTSSTRGCVLLAKTCQGGAIHQLLLPPCFSPFIRQNGDAPSEKGRSNIGTEDFSERLIAMLILNHRDAILDPHSETRQHYCLVPFCCFVSYFVHNSSSQFPLAKAVDTQSRHVPSLLITLQSSDYN